MKNLYFLVVAMLCNFLTFSQNYHLLNKNLTTHYKVSHTYDTPVYTLKADSVSFDGTDSIYFTNRYISDYNSCLTTNSLLSNKIIIKNDGTQFLINAGDTITIKNSSTLNEIWKVFTFPYDNSYLEAKYVSKSLSSFLGLSDSVKYYKVFRRSANGTLLSTNPFSDDTIKISKNYGIIQGYEFLAFWGYPTSNVTKLVSVNGIDEQYRPKTYVELFSFEIGDVFHRKVVDKYEHEFIGNYSQTYDVSYYQNDSIRLKVLDKQFFGDSIKYTFLREINQVFDTVITLIKPDLINNYTGLLQKNFSLDSLNNNFSYDAHFFNSIVATPNPFGVDFIQSISGSENETINADTTCLNYTGFQSFPYIYDVNFAENLGILSYLNEKYESYEDFINGSDYYTFSYSDNLEYFSKGTQEQGVPLFNKITSNKINSCDGEVTFSAHYANAISYLWDFGDGFTSTDMNPTHVYTIENDYSVSLTMVTHFGTYTLNLANQINVGDHTIANFPSFATSLDETCNTYIVTDLSNSPGTRSWDFGGIGTGVNISEIFTFTPGDSAYIKLTIIDGFCEFNKINFIEIDTLNLPIQNQCLAKITEGSISNLFDFKINGNEFITPYKKYPANYFVNACKHIEINQLYFNLLHGIGYTVSDYDPSFGYYDRYDQHAFKIWLDLNDDGIFTSDEKIHSFDATWGEPFSYPYSVDEQINVPNSVLRNKFLRLRLSIEPNGDDPCTGLNYDFSLFVASSAIINETSIYNNKLYPNPSNGDFNYFVSDPRMINSVTIVNELGQELYHSNQINTEMNIILLNASSGIYFMKTNGVKGLETIKFVVE